MKKSKFDATVTTLIEKGHRPVDHLWSELAIRLDEAALQQNKTRRLYWKYTAMVLLVLGMSSIVLPPIDEVVTKEAGKKIVSGEALLKKEHSREKFAPLSIHKNPNVLQDKEFKHSKKQLLPVEGTITIATLQLFETEFSKMDLNKTGLQKLLNERETEALLKAALQELARQEDLDALKLQQTAQGLLASVEAEVEREATLKYRILELLKTGVTNLENVVTKK